MMTYEYPAEVVAEWVRERERKDARIRELEGHVTWLRAVLMDAEVYVPEDGDDYDEAVTKRIRQVLAATK